MHSLLKRAFALAAGAAMLGSIASAQTIQFKVPITASNGTNSQALVIGFSGDGAGPLKENTIGFDLAANVEAGFADVGAAPAPPPPFAFDARLVTIPGRVATFPTGLGAGAYEDYRGFVGVLSQVDTFKVVLSGDDVDAGSSTITWPAGLGQYANSWIIKDQAASASFPQQDMTTTTSLTVPAGSPKNILIIKSGFKVVTPGPLFALDKSSINFGTVGVGTSKRDSVVVSNDGTTNDLSISSVVSSGAPFTVVPSGAVSVPHGSSVKFYVTYAPTAGGAASGSVTFAYSSPAGGPTVLALSGTGLSQGGTLGFAGASRDRFDNTTGYEDSLSLQLSGNPLKALQFQLVVKNGLVIFRSIEKGNAIASPANAWSLNTTFVRGTVQPDGSSNDTIKAVLYGTGTTSLPAGNYSQLIKFKYDAVNITEPDTQSTAFGLLNVVSSLFDGSSAGVNAGADQSVRVLNRSLYGDINNDDRVDILDLLMIVDHILGKSVLTGAAFTRADVAPFPAGDGVINVQDLALLQNIILTGQYPNGVRIMKTAPLAVPVAANELSSVKKVTLTADARVTFHMTALGIVVRLENTVAVKGLQLELDGVSSVPKDMPVTVALGNGTFSLNASTLRVLVYDAAGAVLAPGDRIVANLPFSLAKPGDVTVGGVIVAGADNKELGNVQIEKTLEAAPELPVSFDLSQNYPNPFNPTTTIRFSVPQTSDVKLVIFNALGQQVRTLFSGTMDRGTKTLSFDGRDDLGRSLASGTYIYRMQAGSFTQVKKMLLVK